MKNWKKFEILWLIIATTIITGLSIYWKDTPIGIISAVTGVLCVICTGKGSLWAYIWGTINCALYGWIALESKFFWEVALNWIYYLPLQFYGFYYWKQYMNDKTGEVKKIKMSNKNLILMLSGTLIGTLILGYISKLLGGNLPFIDALSTTVSIVAMIVSIKRYSEQWLLWIIVDIITVILWGYNFIITGGEDIATLLMWIIYLLNAIFAYIKWEKECKTIKTKKVIFNVQNWNVWRKF